MRRLAQLLLLLAMTLPIGAYAMGLGSIELNSALNQPLDAEIELVSATPAELDSLSISLASADAFASYGLDRPAYLLGMQFRVVRDGRGGAVIRVSTSEPVREPFVTFLLEADWSRGRLLREYTVLLDPPVFMSEEAATPPAPVRQTAPTTTQPSAGPVAREPATPPARPVTPPPASQPATTQPRSDALSTRYGPIRRNETLWTIANRIRPDRSVSINQMMIALFRENPQAFMGNINRLKQGAVLRVPSTQDIYALSSDEAFAEVRRQNAAWRGARAPASQRADSGASAAATESTRQGSQGRLRLVPPGDAARQQPGQADPTRAADSELAGNAALSERIQTLESELENARRVIDVKDSELAALQSRLDALEARLADQMAAEADAAGAETTEAGDTETGIADTGADAAAAEDATAQTAGEDMGAPEPVAEPADEPVAEEPPPAVVTTTVEEPGLVAKILDFLAGAWVWILGLLGIGAIAAVALMMRKRSGDEELADSWETGQWKAPEEAGAPAPAPAADVSEDDEPTQSQPAPQFEGDESFVVVEAEDTITEETLRPGSSEEADDFTAALGDAFEDTGTFTPGELEVEKAEQSEEAATEDDGEYPFEDTMIGHDALKLDESDPVAEADFHMAYGLYDQAAALVERAAEKEPDRKDLKAKLLEIFFVWGNKDRFMEEAQAFKTNFAGADASEWEKVVIMGKQLAPDEDLFVNTEATGVFSAPDLEFADEGDEGTKTDLDMLGGDEADDGLSFDLSGGTDEVEAADEDDIEALTAQMEKQAEPSEETLDLGSTHLDLDLESEGAAPDELDITDINRTVADEAVEEDTSPTDIAPADGLDEDMEIDIDFQFEDVEDDEPTAMMEDVGSGDDGTAVMGQVAGDSDHTAMMDQIDEDDLTQILDGDDEDEATRIQKLDAPAPDDADMTTQTPALGADDDHGATMQMKTVDLDDADGDEDETAFLNMDDDDDDAATAMFKPEDGEAGDATAMFKPDEGDAGDATAMMDVGGDATQQMPQFGGDETVQISREDLVGGDETVQVGRGEGFAGGDETVQISRDDLPEDDDRTVQVNYGDASPDMTTQMPAMGATDDFADEDLDDEEESTQKLKALDLPDEEQMDEVGTKLDLAKAFIDMGDPDGARNILYEVLDEGNDAQKKEAQELLDGLG